MASIPHIPILRMGRAYRSLDVKDVPALGSGVAVAQLSIGNAGLVRRDASLLHAARESLRRFTSRDLVKLCADAGERFMRDTLPLGDATQSPDDYITQLSLTSGLPHTLVRRNMEKIHDALTHLDRIVAGLTRGLPPEVLDTGRGNVAGIDVSFYPTTTALGVVMPNNSPGVNALWLPALAMETPVVLRPGSEEPWTPWRIIQSLFAAGLPSEAIGFYPSDHETSSAIMDACDRSIIFGGADTAARYAGDERVEVHGPGWSKVVLGEDTVDRWRDYLDVLVDSIAANSGRSCINASTILTPRHGKAIARAVAEKLTAITPLAPDDPNARLSAIANPAMAAWAGEQIDLGLAVPGARDLTAELRGNTPRLVVRDGMTYLLPTLIHCDTFDHPLANREFMFPFAAVVELPQRDVTSRIGPTLVLSAVTSDAVFIDDLLACRSVQRLNLGRMPTSVAHWDQPHEGNLFDLLYKRRAIQRAEVTA